MNDLTRSLQELNKKAVKSKQAVVDSSRTSSTPQSFFQCVVFYKETVPKRNFLDKPFFVERQFCSPEIFMSETDVGIFAPYFVKRLIDRGSIGGEVVLEDKSVDQELVERTVTKLTPTMMERMDRVEDPKAGLA
jgi:hypothetical protein